MFFISYQSASREQAFDLRDRLQNAGFPAWVFNKDLRIGDEWKVVIDNSIIQSSAVIVIVTLAALRSQYVTYEWSFALGKGKRVIPLIFERPDPNNPDHPPMHPRLDDYQYADTLRETFTWETFIEELKLLETQEHRPTEIVNAVNDLASSNTTIRKHGVDALATHEHPSAFVELIRAIDSGYPDVSINAAFAVAAKTKNKDERVLPGVAKALNRTDTYDHALAILAIMDSPAAINTLETYRKSAQRKIFPERIAETYRKMTHPDIVPVLIEMISENQTTYTFLIEKLGEFRADKAVPSLKRFLMANVERDYEFAWRTSAINSLGQIGGHEATTALIEFLRKMIPNRYLQLGENTISLTVEALVKIGSNEVLEFFEKAAVDSDFHPMQQLSYQSLNTLRKALRT